MVFQAWVHKRAPLNSQWLVLRIGGTDFLHCWASDSIYGTARFKLYKHTRVPYTRHYTSQKIFVACLRALGKVMTSPPLVASKHTCYKLVTSFSTRARNVNALDTCHTRNQLERVFVCIYTCIYLITRWECGVTCTLLVTYYARQFRVQ